MSLANNTRVPDLSATVSPNWWKEEIYPGTEGFLRGTFNYRTRERYLRAFYLDVRPRKSGRHHFNIVPSPARKSISREIRVLLAFNSCSNPKGGGGIRRRREEGKKKKKNGSICEFDLAIRKRRCSGIMFNDPPVSFSSVHREWLSR